MLTRAAQIACIALFAFCSNPTGADLLQDTLAQESRSTADRQRDATSKPLELLAVRVYHDVYYTNNGWTVTPDRFFAMIKRVLKPGGILGIVDHNAQPGSGVRFTQHLHRIDAQFAKHDISNRGFEFLGATDVLDNPVDLLTESVFEPEVRGRTSRFVHKYRKR